MDHKSDAGSHKSPQSTHISWFRISLECELM